MLPIKTLVLQSPPSKLQLEWMLIWSQLSLLNNKALHFPLERQSPPSKCPQELNLLTSSHFPFPIKVWSQQSPPSWLHSGFVLRWSSHVPLLMDAGLWGHFGHCLMFGGLQSPPSWLLQLGKLFCSSHVPSPINHWTQHSPP